MAVKRTKGDFNPSLHPRDTRGRFTKSSTRVLPAADAKRAAAAQASFRPSNVGANGPTMTGGDFAKKTGAKPGNDAMTRYLGGGWKTTNPQLRTEKDAAKKPENVALDENFTPLPEDVLVERRVPLKMFAHIPVDQLEGMKVRDAAPASTILDGSGGEAPDGMVTIHIAVPAGTPAYVVPDTGEILLARDTETAIGKAVPNGRGGWDLYGVTIPRKGATKPAGKASGKPAKPAAGDGTPPGGPVPDAPEVPADNTPDPDAADDGTAAPASAAGTRPPARKAAPARKTTSPTPGRREGDDGDTGDTSGDQGGDSGSGDSKATPAKKAAPAKKATPAAPAAAGDDSDDQGDTAGDDQATAPTADVADLAPGTYARITGDDSLGNETTVTGYVRGSTQASTGDAGDVLAVLVDTEVGPQQIMVAPDATAELVPAPPARVGPPTRLSEVRRNDHIAITGKPAEAGAYALKTTVAGYASTPYTEGGQTRITVTEYPDGLGDRTSMTLPSDAPVEAVPAPRNPSVTLWKNAKTGRLMIKPPNQPMIVRGQAVRDPEREEKTRARMRELADAAAAEQAAGGGKLGTLSDVDRAALVVAVEDAGPGIFQSPLAGGNFGDVGRYVAEGNLRNLTDKYGDDTIWRAVEEYARAHPETLARTPDEVKERQRQRAELADARAAEAAASTKAGDYAAARASIDAGELIDPEHVAGQGRRTWDEMRAIVARVEAAKPPQAAEPAPRVMPSEDPEGYARSLDDAKLAEMLTRSSLLPRVKKALKAEQAKRAAGGDQGDNAPASGAPDTPAAPAVRERMKDKQYRADYLRGWQASVRNTPGKGLEAADDRNEVTAWYEGWEDFSGGRPKWDTPSRADIEDRARAAGEPTYQIMVTRVDRETGATTTERPERLVGRERLGLFLADAGLGDAAPAENGPGSATDDRAGGRFTYEYSWAPVDPDQGAPAADPAPAEAPAAPSPLGDDLDAPRPTPPPTPRRRKTAELDTTAPADPLSAEVNLPTRTRVEDGQVAGEFLYFGDGSFPALKGVPVTAEQKGTGRNAHVLFTGTDDSGLLVRQDVGYRVWLAPVPAQDTPAADTAAPSDGPGMPDADGRFTPDGTKADQGDQDGAMPDQAQLDAMMWALAVRDGLLPPGKKIRDALERKGWADKDGVLTPDGYAAARRGNPARYRKHTAGRDDAGGRDNEPTPVKASKGKAQDAVVDDVTPDPTPAPAPAVPAPARAAWSLDDQPSGRSQADLLADYDTVSDTDYAGLVETRTWPAELSKPEVVDRVRIGDEDMLVVRYALIKQADVNDTPELSYAGQYHVVPADSKFAPISITYAREERYGKPPGGMVRSEALGRAIGASSNPNVHVHIGSGTSPKAALTAALRRRQNEADWAAYAGVATRNVGVHDNLDNLDPDAEIRPGDLVVTYSHQKFRTGVAVKVTKGKVHSLAATPSNPDNPNGSTETRGRGVRLLRAMNAEPAPQITLSRPDGNRAPAEPVVPDPDYPTGGDMLAMRSAMEDGQPMPMNVYGRRAVKRGWADQDGWVNSAGRDAVLLGIDKPDSDYRTASNYAQIRARAEAYTPPGADVDQVDAPQADVPAVNRAPIPAGTVNDMPFSPNGWASNLDGGQLVHYHDDGEIGQAVKSLGGDARLDVDGLPLTEHLNRLATDTVFGKITPQEQLDRLKILADRLPAGPGKRAVRGAVLALDSPLTDPPPVPDSTPEPFRQLMAELHAIPKVRLDGRETDQLAEVLDQFDQGRITPRMLGERVRRAVVNIRHESEEGKAEIDRRGILAIDRFNAMRDADRNAVTADAIRAARQAPAAGTPTPETPERPNSLRSAFAAMGDAMGTTGMPAPAAVPARDAGPSRLADFGNRTPAARAAAPTRQNPEERAAAARSRNDAMGDAMRSTLSPTAARIGDQADEQVLAAISGASFGDRPVSLATVRGSLPGMSRDDVDAALRRLAADGKIQLEPDPLRRMPAMERAAGVIQLGGEDMHLVALRPGAALQATLDGQAEAFVPQSRSTIGLGDRPQVGRATAPAAQQMGLLDMAEMRGDSPDQIAMFDALMQMPTASPPEASRVVLPADAPEPERVDVPEDLAGWTDEQLAGLFAEATQDGDLDSPGVARIIAEWDRREQEMKALLARVPDDLTTLNHDQVADLFAEVTSHAGTLDTDVVDRLLADLDRRDEEHKAAHASKRALVDKDPAQYADDAELAAALEAAGDLGDEQAAFRIGAEWDRRETAARVEAEAAEREEQARVTAERDQAAAAATAAAAEQATTDRQNMGEAGLSVLEQLMADYDDVDAGLDADALADAGDEAARRRFSSPENRLLNPVGDDLANMEEFERLDDQALAELFHRQIIMGSKELGMRAGKEHQRRKALELARQEHIEDSRKRRRLLSADPVDMSDEELRDFPAMLEALPAGEARDRVKASRGPLVLAEANRRQEARDRQAARRAAGPAGPLRSPYVMSHYGTVETWLVSHAPRPGEKRYEPSLRWAEAKRTVLGLPVDADDKAVKAAEKADHRAFIDRAALALAWYRHLSEVDAPESLSGGDATLYGWVDDPDTPDTIDPLPATKVVSATKVWEGLKKQAERDRAAGRQDGVTRFYRAAARTYRIPYDESLRGEDLQRSIGNLVTAAMTRDDRSYTDKNTQYVNEWVRLAQEDGIDPTDSARYGPAPKRTGKSRTTWQESTPAQEAQIAEMVAGGRDWLEAYAWVHGVDVSALRREEAASEAKATAFGVGTTAKAFKQHYEEMVTAAFEAASKGTNGYLLNAAGKKAKVDPLSLFSGSSARANRYASEELQRWWGEHPPPRLTFTQYKQMVQGDRAGVAGAIMDAKGNEFA